MSSEDHTEAQGSEAGGAQAAAAPLAPAPLSKDPAAVAEREQKVLDALLARFGRDSGAIQGAVTHTGRLFIAVDPGALLDVLRHLKDDDELRFGLLAELTCADYLKLPELGPKRFGLLYVLYSLQLDAYVRLRVYVDLEEAEVPSAVAVYPGALWPEREVYDLYGIDFPGHPDLKRLLLPEYYTGHPLRKDYPLKGRGERDSFPVVSRSES